MKKTMDWGATYTYQKGDFKQTCDYCGCVFEFQVPGQKGHEYIGKLSFVRNRQSKATPRFLFDSLQRS